MTGWQCHLIDLGHVPGRDNHTTRVGIVLQLIEYILYLVNDTSVVVGPRAPLVTIDGSEFAILISPLVPDAYAMLLQIFHVGIAFQEPQQFVDDTLQVELFRCEQRETVVEVIATLCTEDADGAGTCTVALFSTFGKDSVEDV